MTNLPELRRADCGHWIPEDVPPAGTHIGTDQAIYLCSACDRLAREQIRPKIESKAPSSTTAPVHANVAGMELKSPTAVTTTATSLPPPAAATVKRPASKGSGGKA